MADYAEEAIRRYQSFEVTEWLSDISKLCRDISGPRVRVSLVQMRNLLLLVQQTIKLMEQDEKHIEEMLADYFERRAQNQSRNHSTDLVAEGVCQPEQLPPGTG